MQTALKGHRRSLIFSAKSGRKVFLPFLLSSVFFFFLQRKEFGICGANSLDLPPHHHRKRRWVAVILGNQTWEMKDLGPQGKARRVIQTSPSSPREGWELLSWRRSDCIVKWVVATCLLFMVHIPLPSTRSPSPSSLLPLCGHVEGTIMITVWSFNWFYRILMELHYCNIHAGGHESANSLFISTIIVIFFLFTILIIHGILWFPPQYDGMWTCFFGLLQPEDFFIFLFFIFCSFFLPFRPCIYSTKNSWVSTL